MLLLFLFHAACRSMESISSRLCHFGATWVEASSSGVVRAEGAHGAAAAQKGGNPRISENFKLFGLIGP